MNTYYKIPPEWAEKIGVTDVAIQHPDGWYMILPGMAARLVELAPQPEDAHLMTIEEAVQAVGGVCYTQEQALASQRGEEAYMMPRPSTENGQQETDNLTTDNRQLKTDNPQP